MSEQFVPRRRRLPWRPVALVLTAALVSGAAMPADAVEFSPAPRVQTAAGTVSAAPVVWKSAARFSSAPKPKIVGKAVIGATLKTQLGSWKPAPKLSYQWLRNGQPVKGGTKASYTLTATDVGKTLTVRVTASKAGYTTVRLNSAATGKVQRAVTYPNCTALNRVYPNGVGKPGARDRVSGKTKPVTNFLVSAQLYQANAKSDRDKDGIACEKR